MSLVKSPRVTEKKLAAHQLNGRRSRGVRRRPRAGSAYAPPTRQSLRVLPGQQNLNTETAERAVPSVLKGLRHSEHGENGRFQLSASLAGHEPAAED